MNQPDHYDDYQSSALELPDNAFSPMLNYKTARLGKPAFHSLIPIITTLFLHQPRPKHD